MGVAYAALLLVVILSWAALYSVWRHRRIARSKKEQEKKALFEEPPNATPRERLIGLSGSLRAALTDRFGTSYRARTTEELGADGELGELLGVERFEQLIQFLDQIDRLKFAPVRALHHQHALEKELVEWEPRVMSLATQIRAKPSGKAATKRFHRPWDRARRQRHESERR
jgi:hypothetical protein